MFYIKGTVEHKSIDSVVVEAGGIGYKVFVPVSTLDRLPSEGNEVKLFIYESVAMYGGSTTRYGFFTEQEKEIFSLLKEEIPGAGAKKALDYLDKVTKSLSDFKKAIVNKDIEMLTGVFGFTKKTAEKMVVALKEKVGQIASSGPEKWTSSIQSGSNWEAIQGLIALGYKEMHARSAVEKVLSSENSPSSLEEVIKRALKAI